MKTEIIRKRWFSAGVKHMLWATWWFALMNLLVKLLAHLPTMELVFFRCGVASLIGFIALQRAGINWIGSNRKLLLLRGLFGNIALFTFFYTLQHMPLGTAVTIQYLSPVFTSLFAIILLKEKVMPVQWIFFLVSFSGVVLVHGWDGNISWELLLIGVISAVFSALAYNMVRTLREKEHPLVVVLHFQLLGAVAGGVSFVIAWEWPHNTDWLLLLLVGVFTHLGQEQLTRSLQSENIARVSILNYLGIGYALIFGVIFFRESYSPKQLLGMLMVISGVAVNLLVSGRHSSHKG